MTEAGRASLRFAFAIAAFLGQIICASVPFADATPLPSAALAPTGTLEADLSPATQVSAWKSRLDRAAQDLTPMTGQWVTQDAVPGITWLQILLSALAVLTVAGVERSLHVLMRRAIRRRAANPATRESWLRRILESVPAPFALLVWVWGIGAALAILLADLSGRFSLVQLGLAWLLKIGNFAALFWFVFRLLKVVEIQLERWAARSESKWDSVLAILAGRALRWIVPLVAVIMLLPALRVSAGSEILLNQSASVAMILAIGFILVQLVNAVEEGVARRIPPSRWRTTSPREGSAPRPWC